MPALRAHPGSDVQGSAKGHGPCSSWRYSEVLGGVPPPLCVSWKERDRLWLGEGFAWQLSREGTNHELWGLGFFSRFLLPGQAFTHFLR